MHLAIIELSFGFGLCIYFLLLLLFFWHFKAIHIKLHISPPPLIVTLYYFTEQRCLSLGCR